MELRSFRSAALAGLLMTTAPLFAQEAKFKVDVNADLLAVPDDGVGIVKMVKGDGGTVVALKTAGGKNVFGGVSQKDMGWTLATYDVNTLKMTKTDAPKIVYGLTQVNLETIEHFNGKLRLLATQPDPEAGVVRFIQQVLEPRSLTGKGAQQFHTMPFDQFGKGADYYQPHMAVGFSSMVSQDSSMLLMQLNPDLTVRAAGCPTHAMVFDKDMKLKWQRTLRITGNLEAQQIIATRLDKNGSVWYLTKNITKLEPTDLKEIGYDIVLYKLDSAGQHEVKLDLPGSDYASDARIEMLPDGRVFCAGVYGSDDLNRGDALGLFTVTLDPATASDPKGMQWGAFHQNELNKNEDKKKGELPQKNVVMVRAMLRKDGGADVVAENNPLEYYTSSSLGGKSFQKPSWQHGKVHVMRFTASGSVTFYTMIDRNMVLEDGVPGRVIAANYQDGLFLFMNDNEAYIDRRKDGLPLERVATATDAMMFEFKSDGTYKCKVLMKDLYHQVFFAPTNVWYIRPGLLAMPGAQVFGKDKTQPVCILFSSGARR